MCVKLKYTFLFTLNVIFCIHYDMWSEMTYGQVWWPILRICALHLTHPKCTHTQQWTHTHTPWTHTRSSGQMILRRLGSSWGFSVWLKGTSVMVLKEKRALYIHSPTNNSCQTWDSNSQPLDYESDSLTIRPRLPHIYSPYICIYILNICVLYNI